MVHQLRKKFFLDEMSCAGIRVTEILAPPPFSVAVSAEVKQKATGFSTCGLKNAGADDEARTRYLHLGKVALYQMSYIREGFNRGGTA